VSSLSPGAFLSDLGVDVSFRPRPSTKTGKHLEDILSTRLLSATHSTKGNLDVTVKLFDGFIEIHASGMRKMTT
jgi:hypothetical protein